MTGVAAEVRASDADTRGDSIDTPSAGGTRGSRLDLERPLTGWLAAISLTVGAFAMRLWHLGTPHAIEYDEVFYAKDAWSLLHFGYAREYVSTANDQILAGHTTGIWTSKPELVVHPEAGKWLIAIGIKLFGMDPFGWRFSAAVVGSLMVLVICRLLRRMTGSTMLGLVGGLLLAFDGLQFVLSRLALLDIFAAFFVLSAVTAMVCDRDWFRARLAARQPVAVTSPRSRGPIRGLLWRPWLFWSGILWGLACGTKWDAVYPMVAFGVLSYAWTIRARQDRGVRRAALRCVVIDGVPAFLQVVVVALLVYLATWGGWLAHYGTYEQNLSHTQYTQFVVEDGCQGPEHQQVPVNLIDPRKFWPTVGTPPSEGVANVSRALRDLWYYHQDVYTFHTHFLNCSWHAYGSKPAGWLVLNRPVVTYYVGDIEPGTYGCTAARGSTCDREVMLLGTPTLWWGGSLALIFALVMWVGRRDWRFGLTVVGAAATWLPWLRYADRPIFSYYTVVTLPFLVTAVVLAIGKLIGPSRTPTARRTVGVLLAGAFIVLVIANFAWFWPVYTGQLLTHHQWLQRIWFKRWI